MQDNTNNLNRRQFMGAGALGVTAVALGATSGFAREVAASPVSGRRAKISWRIHEQSWRDPKNFGALRAVLEEHKRAVDEICLFESPGVAYFPPISVWQATADAMVPRLESLRRLVPGRIGVNVLVTLGGGRESAPASQPGLQLPAMIGHDGTASQCSPCPNRPEVHSYIAAKYAAFAKLKPDFIWVDEDVRMNHLDIAWGCFCDFCLDRFSKEVASPITRTALVSELDKPEATELRHAWIERNARSVESIFSTIREAVRTVGPEIEMGWMHMVTAYHNYAGTRFARWMAALDATRSRPGSAYYWDTMVSRDLTGARLGGVVKAAGVARQMTLIPPAVHDRQYEYETWPHGEMVKSPATALNEVAVALASGCNGAAFNSLGWSAPYDGYGTLMSRLAEAHSYFDSISEHAADHPAQGLWTAWSPEVMGKRRVLPGEGWLSQSVLGSADYDPDTALPLALLGVPLAAEQGRSGSVLIGRIAETLDDEVLNAMLAGGVLMDTLALRELQARGLGDLAGVRVSETVPVKMAVGMSMARFTEHPLNGRFAGAAHNCSAILPAAYGHADILAPLSKGVEVLANLEQPTGDAHEVLTPSRAPCLTIFENRLGGRVAVSGYSPWFFLHSHAKRHQLIATCDWLTRGTLPVRVVDPAPITPYVRLSADRRHGVVVLWNTGLEHLEMLKLELRVPRDVHVRLAAPSAGPSIRVVSASQGHIVELRDMPAWSTVALLVGTIA